MQHTIALPGNEHLPKGLLDNTAGCLSLEISVQERACSAAKCTAHSR